MNPVDYPWLIYYKNMHYILTDRFGLDFVVAAHQAFYSTLHVGGLNQTEQYIAINKGQRGSMRVGKGQ